MIREKGVVANRPSCTQRGTHTADGKVRLPLPGPNAEDEGLVWLA